MLKKFFTNDLTQETSTRKFWRNIAFALATYIVYVQRETLTWEFLAAYLVSVGGVEILNDVLVNKGRMLTGRNNRPPMTIRPDQVDDTDINL